ncbi:MAG: WG repeat-containing protein [Bacteroidales bacterium]|nr:WG repeat-containing protein [Bacteroidales bacterium]
MALGAYDRSGKIICDALYDQIIKITDNLYKVGVKEKDYTEWFEEYEVIRWGLIDGDGNEILPHEYPEISSSVVDGMIKIVNQYGECGFVDITGRFILEPDTFKYVGDFKDGLAIVSRSYRYSDGTYYGVVDCSFAEVIPCVYKELYYLAAEGRFKMENGHITKDGQFIAKCDGKEVLLDKKYKFCHEFNNGLAIAQRHFYDSESGKIIVRYGLINSNAEDVFPPEYESIRLLENGAYRLLKDGRFGFADKNGKTLLQPVCERLFKPHEDHSVVKINGSWGLLDMRKFTISMFLTASYLGPCQDKACAINEGGNISEDGRHIIGGKWGFVSPEGKVMVPPEYERITSFCDGAVAVKKDGSWGFVDRRGRVLVPLEYDNVSKSFREGAAGVKKDGRWGFVDKRGVVLVPLEYENVSSFHEDVVAVKKDGKWGFVGRRGEVIVPCEYDSLESDYRNGYGELEKDWVIHSFDKEGREVEWRFKQDEDYSSYDDDSPSYSKYGGPDGYDDRTIDEAFDGDPSLLWNMD